MDVWGTSQGTPHFPETLREHRTSPGLHGQCWYFLKRRNALGFVIIVWLLDFTLILACSKKKKSTCALAVLPTPCTYRTHCISKCRTSIPCAILQPGLGGGQRLASPSHSKGDGHRDSRFDKAGHAGNHSQVASDLQFPNSSSLLSPAARVDQQDKP